MTGLIDLLRRFPHNNELSDSEMVQIVQMGSYFARNTVGWTLAPDNLDHWLDAGGLQDPAQIMDRSLIMNQERVIDTLCDEHYDVIVDGIKNDSRRRRTPSSRRRRRRLRDHSAIPSGQPGRKPAARRRRGNALPAEQHAHDRDSGSDLFNAVNAVNLVSQVRVKSEVLDTGAGR